MKRTINKIGILAILLFPISLFAQEKVEQQTGDTTYYKSLIPEAKQGLLSRMSMIANMQFALRNEFVDGEYVQSRFKNEQFRLEFRGMIHDKIYFRFDILLGSNLNLYVKKNIYFLKMDVFPRLSF